MWSGIVEGFGFVVVRHILETREVVVIRQSGSNLASNGSMLMHMGLARRAIDSA